MANKYSCFGTCNHQIFLHAFTYDYFRLAAQPEPHQYQALYNINGLVLGQTSFKIVTRANIFKGIQYASDTYPIQVCTEVLLLLM